MFSERSPSRSASSSRTGPPSATRVRSSRRVSIRSSAPTPSRAAIETIVAGSASAHSTIPTAGPSSHGPTSRPSSPASPLTPRPASATASRTGASAIRSPSSATGSLSSSIAATRQYAALLRSSSQPARGGARDRGQVRRQQPVGLAPLTLGEPPRQPDRAAQDRQADPQRGEHDAEHESAADDHQVGQALAETHEQVQQRATGVAQVRGEVDRRDQFAASTVTSPLVLSACTRNGASGASESPRTRTAPESLCASIW